MIVLLNGAFGIGKTTVAREIVARLPRTLVFDPELIGFVLQRLRRVNDFQDLALWRRLTIVGLSIARRFRPNIIVPMAISNVAYLNELRDGIRRFDPHVVHICLVAPIDVVHERLQGRGAEPWSYRRASECCAVHGSDAFAAHVAAANRLPAEIADEIVRAMRSARDADSRPRAMGLLSSQRARR